MTAAQAARCNAALAPGRKDKGEASDPQRWLSPRQIALLTKIQNAKSRDWPVAVDVSITEAWAKLPD